MRQHLTQGHNDTVLKEATKFVLVLMSDFGDALGISNVGMDAADIVTHAQVFQYQIFVQQHEDEHEHEDEKILEEFFNLPRKESTKAST
jgi:hypothetical protein